MSLYGQTRGSPLNFDDYYGLHEKGPMETFITNYYKVNGNLDVFSDIPDYLNVINTAVVEEIIDANQLKDVCDEENRVLIIYNESFWKVLFEQASYPRINDFKWIVTIEGKTSKFGYLFKNGEEEFFDNKRVNKAIIRALKENVLTSNVEDEIKYNFHVTLCYIYFCLPH